MDIPHPPRQRLRSGQGRQLLGLPLVVIARTVALAVLVLTVLAGAGGGPAMAQDEAPGPNVAGTVVQDMLTIQGIVAQDNDRVGSYEYLVDITASADVADGYRLAGAGEQTYIAVDSTTFEDIDVASTDASGVAVLDGEVGSSFYVYEVDDVDAGGIPLGTDDLFLPANDPNPAITLTGIYYVAGPAVEPEPSVAPPVEPSAEPLPPGTATGTILPNAISVQGVVVEDADRAGETDYLLNVTTAAEVGGFRSAREGEQTYQVVDLASGTVIDQASTDANGQAVLDGEVDAAYYVVEISDRAEIPGTDSLFYAAGDPNAFIALTAVVYVSQLEPDPSPSPSPDRPVSPSPVGSERPAASPSVAERPSPVAGSSDDPGPSGDPSDPGPSVDANPSPVASVVASAVSSAGASAEPSTPDETGETVTITILVPLPDGVQICLGDQCQILRAGRGASNVIGADRQKAVSRRVIAQTGIPAGTVVVFRNVPPGTYRLTISLDGVLLYATAIDVVAGQPASGTIDDRDRVDPPAATSPGAVVAGDGIAGPSAAASRAAAPVVSQRSGTSTLPNTGAGPEAASTPLPALAAWLAGLAGLVAAAIAFRLRRRGA